MAFERILKVSALMGASQIIQLLAAFARAKLTALVLGPSGVGLVGLLTSFNGNLSALTGWGLGTSGVRAIASAEAEARAARIASVRRLGALLSLAGLALALIFASPAGGWILLEGHPATTEILIAGMAVPCVVISGGWAAILQAKGHLRPLARVQVVGAVIGLIVGAPLIWWFGTKGLAVSLALAAAVPALMLWAATRRLEPPEPDVRASSLRPLLVMGGALMLVGLFAQASAYLVRMQLVEFGGLKAAGYYHAAFAVAGSLPGFVFVAMGADFFPRVAGAASESEAAVHADHQVAAGLILGTPLLSLLLSAGGPIMATLYAAGFDPSLPLLDWMVWGVFLRIISWPLGYWLLARGSSKAVIAVEGLGGTVMTALPLVFLPMFGLVGAAIAYAVGYLVHAAVLLVMARRQSGSWLSGRTILGAIASAIVLLCTQLAAGIHPYCGWVTTAAVTAASLIIGRRALAHSRI
ncbi:MAG: oligosaccharide flippase family protein [Verrucomicrobiota bacterium]